jgi:hypothetical protein
VLALVPAILVTTATGSALAAPPEQWEENGPVSPLHVILLLVVIPVALFALIWLLVYLPSMRKGQHYQPGLAWRGEPEWFGGPRRGVEPADAPPPAPAGARGPERDADSDRGGASGRW